MNLIVIYIAFYANITESTLFSIAHAMFSKTEDAIR